MQRAAQMNGLQMIVRAHECVMDGFERFAQGHLITLFSATNYCGTANNAGAFLGFSKYCQLSLPSTRVPTLSPHSQVTRTGAAGAILVLGRDLVMVPKLIHPLPPNTPHAAARNGADDEVGSPGCMAGDSPPTCKTPVTGCGYKGRAC